MSIEQVAAEAAKVQPLVVDAGYGSSIADRAAFEQALAGADSAVGQTPPVAALSVPAPHPVAGAGPGGSPPVMPALRQLFTTLERVDAKARAASDEATRAMQEGRDLTSGEVIQMSMRSHEFMFHCQLSATVANRTSEGLQQLFRQQA